MTGTPLVHFVSGDEKAAMFGTFTFPNAEAPSPSQTFLATDASSDGREMIDVLRRMFELAWQHATPVPRGRLLLPACRARAPQARQGVSARHRKLNTPQLRRSGQRQTEERGRCLRGGRPGR